MKLFTRILAALGVICAAAACQKFNFEFIDPGITDGELSIHAGESHYIETDTDLECVWTSSDESIARVNNGTVTGISKGECTISAECNRCTRSVNVRVLSTDVTDFKMPSSLQVVPGYTSTFEVSDFVPSYANAEMLRWSFATTYPDNEHFSVSASGNSVYVSADKTTPKDAQALLIAQGSNRTNEKGEVEECKALISIRASDFYVTFSPTLLKIFAGDTYKFYFSTTPDEVLLPFTWSTDNPEVARCENGLLTALSEGSATIKLSVDGKDYGSCSVTVLKKNVIEDNYKICFYRTREALPDYPGIYILSDKVSSVDVIPGSTFSTDIFIGSENGYTIPLSELERISGEGKNYYTISGTGLPSDWSTNFPGGRTDDSFPVWMDPKIDKTGTVNVTAPNGSKATLTVRSRIGTVTVGNKLLGGFDGTTASGGTITIHRDYGNHFFYLNTGSAYDAKTSCALDFNYTCMKMKFPEEFSNADGFNTLRITPSTPLKTYEFHILDGPTSGKEIDYVVKINLVD